MSRATDVVTRLAAGGQRAVCEILSRDEVDDVRALLLQGPDREVRMLHGNRCRTKQGLMAEMSAALQFPLYFQPNWDAVLDCLSDMSWVEYPELVLVVARADQLLADEPQQQMTTFLEVIALHLGDRPPGGTMISILLAGEDPVWAQHCPQIMDRLAVADGSPPAGDAGS